MSKESFIVWSFILFEAFYSYESHVHFFTIYILLEGIDEVDLGDQAILKQYWGLHIRGRNLKIAEKNSPMRAFYL